MTPEERVKYQYINYPKVYKRRVRKLIGQDHDTNSATFGKFIYEDKDLTEMIEAYAEYRCELALASYRGASVFFVREWLDWLEMEPLED